MMEYSPTQTMMNVHTWQPACSNLTFDFLEFRKTLNESIAEREYDNIIMRSMIRSLSLIQVWKEGVGVGVGV